MQPDGGKEHGSRRGTWDGEGEQGNHGTTDTGIVCRLCRGQALVASLTEQVAFLASSLANIVGNPRGDVFACSGNSSDTAPDQAGTNCSMDDVLDNFLIGQYTSKLAFDGVWHILLQNRKDLRDAEYTDEGGNQGDATHQAVAAIGEAREGIHGIEANHGGEEAEEAYNPALDRGALGREVSTDHDAEDGDEEVLPLPELQGDLIEERGQENKDDDGKQGSDEGGDDAHSDCLSAMALLGQDESIQCSCCCRGCSGDVDHDGGVTTSHDRPYVDSQQEGHGNRKLHGVGQIDQQGESHGCSKAGNRPYDDACNGGDHGYKYLGESECLGGSGPEQGKLLCECFKHRFSYLKEEEF
jgi:hypothetical protein